LAKDGHGRDDDWSTFISMHPKTNAKVEPNAISSLDDIIKPSEILPTVKSLDVIMQDNLRPTIGCLET
jgi:hypothetical protein